MTYDMIEKKIAALPDSYIAQVIDYIDYLQYRASVANAATATRRRAGLLKGTVEMSDDFDEVPDCFEEYA